MFKALLSRERWYERVGVIPARNKPAMVMLAAISYQQPPIAIDYLDPVGDMLTVRLGNKDRHRLEEFAEDLAAADVEVNWSPIRTGDPRAEQVRAGERLARSLEAVAQATTRSGAGPSLAVVVETMGHAAANVHPSTAASRRTRAALTTAYRDLTGAEAPF